MSNPPPIPPAEVLAIFVRSLVHAVVTRGLWWNLPSAIVSLIVNRTREIKLRFARLAARIEAGTFVPRRAINRRKPLAPRKPPDRRPFGWLRPLLPEAPSFAGHLERMLAEPAMVALMQAAPAEMARLFRPLCWMLRVKPPSILAPPKRQPPPETTPEAESAPSPSPKPPAPPPQIPAGIPAGIRPARRARRQPAQPRAA